MKCRFCQHDLSLDLVDLNYSPPSNSFLTSAQLSEPEMTFPLKVQVCDRCWLGQVDEHKHAADIFSSDYVYFSSFSSSWLAHAKRYVADISTRLNLGDDAFVVEVASNDGYLLQYFKERGVPCLGVEPTGSTAEACRSKGIEVVQDFFGERLGAQLTRTHRQADLILGNNVFAHVPDINDFVKGLKLALAPGGTVTLEFPHFMQLIQQRQFDTIYHEHFSYLSLHTTRQIFEAHGLRVYDVEQLSTHGGSLRVYGCHEKNSALPERAAVGELLQKETELGMQTRAFFQPFAQQVVDIKLDLLSFLIEQKRAGKKVMGYGAAAKGNTLLNYAGVLSDLLPSVVDLSPHKVGKFLPGVHIPVVSVDEIKRQRPDYLLILPWNLRDEVQAQHAYIREWGGRFVTAIPKLEIL